MASTSASENPPPIGSEAPPPCVPGLESSAAAVAVRSGVATRKRAVSFAYIVGPVYDWLLFLLPPVAALAIGILLYDSVVATHRFEFWDQTFTPAGLFIGMFIHAHLVLVFFRSHGNKDIFRAHPWRFTAVPLLLFGLMNASLWILVSVSVLATFWDVYHSGLQTFGFARIYDRKAGNDALVGRRLDWWLNQLLYAGPIVAGATMIDHFGDFQEFEQVGSAFFVSIPAFMEGNQRYFTWAVVIGGTCFLVYYLYAYARLYRQGHQVSLPKVYLLASTGAVSIYTWGFNTWGGAFFIMNFFHALQYFGIVWAMEKKSIKRIFGVEQSGTALVLFITSAAVYGYFVQAVDPNIHVLWSIVLTVSIMHFWYDGFIWSVQKKQV